MRFTIHYSTSDEGGNLTRHAANYNVPDVIGYGVSIKISKALRDRFIREMGRTPESDTEYTEWLNKDQDVYESELATLQLICTPVDGSPPVGDIFDAADIEDLGKVSAFFARQSERSRHAQTGTGAPLERPAKKPRKTTR